MCISDSIAKVTLLIKYRQQDSLQRQPISWRDGPAPWPHDASSWRHSDIWPRCRDPVLPPFAGDHYWFSSASVKYCSLNSSPTCLSHSVFWRNNLPRLWQLLARRERLTCPWYGGKAPEKGKSLELWNRCAHWIITFEGKMSYLKKHRAISTYFYSW